ncbi:hypothetical protein FPQ18DRAFT_375136 [Pyronema domesticum]|nr:hypothetical protein FPQ18DRAFT_375136 [Pyronema domesticum]
MHILALRSSTPASLPGSAFFLFSPSPSTFCQSHWARIPARIVGPWRAVIHDDRLRAYTTNTEMQPGGCSEWFDLSIHFQVLINKARRGDNDRSRFYNTSLDFAYNRQRFSNQQPVLSSHACSPFDQQIWSEKPNKCFLCSSKERQTDNPQG